MHVIIKSSLAALSSFQSSRNTILHVTSSLKCSLDCVMKYIKFLVVVVSDYRLNIDSQQRTPCYQLAVKSFL